ncbi:TetR/AcrR family transcriptional regulator [Rhodococcus triatomae]|nr:TetR family transcriptional regulator [Rhodococcus triatomae BKS 15-14]
MTLSLADMTPPPPPVTTPAGERVIDAASALFYANGIGAVGVDRIADAAGVTKRTLYQRFGSKDALVVVYLQRRAHRWQTTVLAALAHGSNDVHPVATVFDTAEQWAAANPRGCAFVNAWAELGTTQHPAIAVIADEKQWMRELFSRLVGHPELARSVHLLHEGAHVLDTTLGDEHAYRRARDAALQLLGTIAGSGS